ncbi:MAG: leucine--tRNA ligase, partial [Muribaculaceae bacterium]|nr:leucine--tRNA ligase [Muribaculaceae bacterium]
MEYNFREIEQRWQEFWRDNDTYRVKEDASKPKFYVLDMFPYPSGAGLHVGHPLGYIASDIYARYKRLKGFNVLHPMGYDAYGLPAEQYAIQTGQHPAITTQKNIERYRNQLDKIGFCFDWNREVRTCDPGYYRWTQWAFEQMFMSYYDNDAQKAMPISSLVEKFSKEGTQNLNAACGEEMTFTAEEWNAMDKIEQEKILLNYRIAYLGDTMVNWCPKLGTVLANDEVSEGVSIRGGYPVEQKVMRQWCLRVSAYAQRLLEGLDKIDWSDSLKETQRNWIGRSEGAEMQFKVANSDVVFTIFTTRADTIFGVTFMVLAPESEYVNQVVTADQQEEVNKYLDSIKHRTERERIADLKVTGVFTGAYAINPLNNKEIPIYISDYVLAGYGTGAIMAVPAHDSRDYAFAKTFNLPIIPLIEGCDVSEESFDAKEGKMMNSEGNGLNLNGLDVKEAIAKTKEFIKENNLGKVKVNYRLRDAIFSRQRYWGEPFPVYYKDGMPHLLPDEKLPLQLPEIDKYLPTESGEPPLGRAKNWETAEHYPLELCTMPGFAGSSAYYLRYMDPHNPEALVSKEANEYWRNVDLYIGGTEHATGHLIYSRFWNKFLFDLGVVCEDEPFKKLVNQGMIQGRSNFVYRIKDTNTFVSLNLKGDYETTPIHVDVNIVSNDRLDIEAFRNWNPEYKNAEFILENGEYV